jgi:hypothetical protein
MASCPEGFWLCAVAWGSMPGVRVLFVSMDSVLRPCMHMVARFETEINSVIVIGIYEYIFQRSN